MKKLLLALALFLLPISAEAASRFWVPLVVTGAISGTGGLCRLTVNDTANLSASASVIVAGILGATACDGTTTVTTVVDATHVEVNLAFGLTYTSGGTVAGGKWASTGTGNWSASTGGAGGASIPGIADTAIFDGNSGAGMVIPDTTLNGTNLGALTAGAFTGTLDFSVNNPSMTIATSSGIVFSGAGAGRIFKLGSGTFTLNAGAAFDFSTITGIGACDFTGVTLIFNAASINPQQIINLGGQHTKAVTINGRATGTGVNISGAATVTIDTLNINGPVIVYTGNTSAITATAMNITGTSSAPVMMIGANANSTVFPWTVTTATFTYAAFRSINFSGAVSATNSYDLGNNTNLSIISNPSGGGGGHIIGG